MSLLADELAVTGVRTKVRSFSNGRTVGGIPLTLGPLAALLKNPVYVGKVAHGGKLYDGEHEAIIDDALWEAVQSGLATNRWEHRLGKRSRYPSLLTGMISDPEGQLLPISWLAPDILSADAEGRQPVTLTGAGCFAQRTSRSAGSNSESSSASSEANLQPSSANQGTRDSAPELRPFPSPEVSLG